MASTNDRADCYALALRGRPRDCTGSRSSRRNDVSARRRAGDFPSAVCYQCLGDGGRPQAEPAVVLRLWFIRLLLLARRGAPLSLSDERRPSIAHVVVLRWTLV